MYRHREEYVHLMGIGGTGLSAIAQVLQDRGLQVSGCDRAPGPMVETLRRRGIPVHIGHEPGHLEDVTLLLRSSAVPPDHLEVQAAQVRGIPVLTRAQFLPRLTQGYRTLAVAGTHGKTTTTAMLAWVLLSLGQDPTYILGGVMANTGRNGRAGRGPYFVIEADEYDHMFLGLRPHAGILTYVDYDHPDCFPNREAYRAAFRAFVERFEPGGVVVYWAQDAEARRVLKNVQGLEMVTYDTQAPADYWVQNLEARPEGTRFVLVHGTTPLATVFLPLPGLHNVRNALAVLALVHQLGMDVAATARALADFRGVERRFTEVARQAGWVLVNDYGHHPVEIATTLDAARQRFPEHTLWAVWQPHTYSRTLGLLEDFARALRRADALVLLPVYPARETRPTGFREADLLSRLAHPRGFFAESLEEATALLLREVRPPAVVLLFSAGDAPALLTRLERALKEGPSLAQSVVVANKEDHDGMV